ncbi:cytochrome c [Rhodobacterales bacterium HKCCE3408]|nr:cytochrome c [Rhodobacterales bacterium HKCCE3408]
MTFRHIAAALAILVATPTLAPAQEFQGQLGARQGQMRIMALNLGILGGMARGNTEYNAELAMIAAQNIHAVTMINQAVMWPEGSNADAIEGTRALPAIWEDFDGFLGHWSDLGAAAETLVAEAGNGLEPMQGALGGLGQECGSCHDAFRQEQ